MRDAVRSRFDDEVARLARAVNIASGTHNLSGVRRVGKLYDEALRELGFETRWISLPDSLHRAGHLVAEHAGTSGPWILLIGHLDTVFEGDDQRWVREDTIGRGAGSSDMKGGNSVMLLALRALADAGRLRDMRVRVILTGDEESPGRPFAVSRAALLDLARRSNVALAFEGGTRSSISVTRRGASSWSLSVTAKQAHSAGVGGTSAGFGALYEGARILDGFRRVLASSEFAGATFNVGLAAGGTTVRADSTGTTFTAEGKTNIVSPRFDARGDLRFLDDVQRAAVRARMRQIVATPLPGARAEITFEDGYPAMPRTAAGDRLVALFDDVNRSLGYGPVTAQSATTRGAGDISFVAPFVPGMDGLGTSGGGSHSPTEFVYLPSLRLAAERAAILMSRLADGQGLATK